MLAFIIGLGYSIVRVYRSTLHPQLDRKRDAIVALVVNALLVLVLGAAVPVYFLSERNPETKPFEWREYVFAGSGYKIQLPDNPQEGPQQVQTAKGFLRLNRVMVNMGKRGEYVSGYFDLSDRTATLSDDELLELLFSGAIGPRGGTVLTKKPLVIDSTNGLTIKALESEVQLDASTTSKLRLYLVRQRSTVYMNLATFQRASNNVESAEQFLDSFELVTH
jgi:hypothetical protein